MPSFRRHPQGRPRSRRERRTLLVRPALALGLLLALGACAAADPARPTVVGGIGMVVPANQSIAPGLSAAGEFLIGNFALERGDMRRAASSFRRALAADPDNLELRRRVFLLGLASGIQEETLVEARRLVEIDPEAEEAKLLLALADARAGRFAQARERFDDIVRAGIIGLALPALDAWAAAGEGEIDEALALLDEATGSDIGGALFAYHKALVLAHGGRLEEAAAALAALVPEDDFAPTRMVAAYADVLARAGEGERARTLLAESIEREGGNLALEARLAALERGERPSLADAEPAAGMADALLGLAEALHQQRAGREALIYARLASFLRPGFAEALLLLGDIAADHDNVDDAVLAYEELPPEHPLAWEARLKTARALFDLERRDETFALLSAMAEERPARVDALVLLGDLLRRAEHYGRAEEAYSRAIARLPAVEREHWPLLYSRGITYERTQRWPEAEADFQRALELEPEQPYVLNYLAYSWVDQGMHLDEALPMLERAVELRPDDGFIVDSLGWVHFRLGNYQQAVVHLERAVELEPGDPILNDHLGDAYWRVGRLREADFQWRRALTLEPEPDTVPEIEAKIERGLPDRAAANTRE